VFLAPNTLSGTSVSTRAVDRSIALSESMQRINDEGGVLVLLGNKRRYFLSGKAISSLKIMMRGCVGKAWQGSSQERWVLEAKYSSKFRVEKNASIKCIKYSALSGFGLGLLNSFTIKNNPLLLINIEVTYGFYFAPILERKK
jgi:3,4-dihydroxy 2-butanone 4-phosphate synthase/GTP cyclohydrolase II